ncbi:MAG: desulfoferrodoxin [archaeon]
MTELNEIYRCNVCGNVVEMLHAGMGELVCCGVPMELLAEKKTDTGLEKHVPVIEKTDSGFTVKVGSVAHPMEDKHYIEWIELIADGRLYRMFLRPRDKPEALFCVKAQNVVAREYCSVHGLWKS